MLNIQTASTVALRDAMDVPGKSNSGWPKLADDQQGARRCPLIEEPSIIIGEVYAAMAHRLTKPVVPVGAVEGMSLAGEVRDPSHPGQVIVV